MLLALLALPAFAAPELHAELSAQALPSTVAFDARVRADGEKDGYVLAAARFDPSGAWIGRAGVGLDVFGGGEGLDLKLGLFLGGTGTLTSIDTLARPTAGGEVLVGATIGRVFGSYRHMDGFAGPLEDRLTEDELRVGFRVTDQWRVHGQWLMLNPGDNTWKPSAGLGVEAVF